MLVYSMPPVLPAHGRGSDVEYDGGDLSVLDGGAVVVAGGVRELEHDFFAVVAVDWYAPQAFGAVVRVRALQWSG